MESTRRRVKVYQLDDGGKWEDKGTGHVTCSYVEQKGSLCLIVNSEEDNTILLESKILNEDIYQRQQETLVVWSEPDSGIDLALSFQEAEGCTEIWHQILSIQHKQNSEALNETDFVGPQADSGDEGTIEPAEEVQRLPPANIANVDEILGTILAADTIPRRERFVRAVINECWSIHLYSPLFKDYIRKLLELFTICEDFEDQTVLYTMFSIFKHLVLMNDTNLMEVLFSDEYMIPMLGALEYDPDIPEHLRIKHRDFLTNNVIFKQVVQFNSVELVERIHQTFRMQYLKDVVLNRVLDDATTLNSLIFFNNLEIVSQLQSDTKFLTELFQNLRSAETTTQQRKDLLLFVQELCNLAKNLQIVARTAFYKSLTDQGLFDVFTTSLKDEDLTMRMSSTDIMLLSLAHAPALLRSFAARQKPDHQLLHLIVQKFTDDPQLGVKSQCAEILKMLIEETPGEETTIKDEFLNVFYQHIIHLLMVPLKRKYLRQSSVAGDLSSGFVQNSICDLLSYCIRHHGYRIKYFLLGNNLPKKVLKLLSHKDTFLVLCAKDDFYNRHIIKENLFAPVMEVFVKNGPRYNLLNSVVLELVDFVRKENIIMLIQYLGDTFGDVMHQVDYVDVFKNILIRYEQIKDGPGRVESSISNGPRKTLKQMEDEEDEAYFRESDDEEENVDTKKSNHIVAPLVDYADDDEVVTTPKTEDEESDGEVKENGLELDKGKNKVNQEDKEQDKEKEERGEKYEKGKEGDRDKEKEKEEVNRNKDGENGKRRDSPLKVEEEEDEPSPKKSKRAHTTDIDTESSLRSERAVRGTKEPPIISSQ